MADERQQLRAVLSSMVEGVVALDAEQRILFANERAGQLLHFDVQQAVGRRLYELVRHRQIQKAVQAVLANARGQQQELNWHDAGGRSLMLHAGPLPGQPPRGVVLVLHDTTELRRLERLRQDFVANVSHELKTPLSVIKATAETLIDGALEEEGVRGVFVQRIAEQAERLHTLILDLLSLARIEAGTETFVFQAVPVARIVESCCRQRQSLAEAKQQTLTAEPPPQPVQAWVDEEALLQILDNLVDNAIKYTPEQGRISVRWWTDKEHVFVEVRDTGLGIPEEQLPRIFERFYRVDRARSRELGGTGLGLSIVKHLAQAMQGSVTAASKMGEGSVFTLRLPQVPG
jgi:two-component system phosphate regulon sensor histidine kinase PhoR